MSLQPMRRREFLVAGGAAVLAGCAVPVPASITFDARPEAVFSASAGAAATSAGV
jgi:hypothetical protein